MSRPEFTWNPDEGSQCSIKPNASSVKFGDGYELRSSSVINSIPEKWVVKFTRGSEEAIAIDTFLRDQKGVIAFTWITPDNTTGVFVCKEWQRARLSAGVHEVSGSFEQVFEY